MSHDYKMRIKMKSSNNLVYVNSTLMVCCHFRISKQIGFGAEISHPPVYFSLYFFLSKNSSFIFVCFVLFLFFFLSKSYNIIHFVGMQGILHFFYM